MKASILDGVFIFITMLFWLLIISIPFLIRKYRKSKTENYFTYLFISIFITFVLSVFSTYWSADLSEKVMDKIYNYNSDGLSQDERLENVSEENRQTMIDISNRNSGIGWPLKVILMFVIFMIPYNFIVCGIIFLINKRKHIR